MCRTSFFQHKQHDGIIHGKFLFHRVPYTRHVHLTHGSLPHMRSFGAPVSPTTKIQTLLLLHGSSCKKLHAALGGLSPRTLKETGSVIVIQNGEVQGWKICKETCKWVVTLQHLTWGSTPGSRPVKHGFTFAGVPQGRLSKHSAKR
ncbi:hypothetical protein NXS19_005106 [Fusarium pseudograminearum]|nr:hypothetical protein NXS19_005106 [Fusarium pseudograminearum]